MSKEKKVTQDAVYYMFSYASLFVCLFQLDRLFSGLSEITHGDFRAFCDCLKHYEEHESLDAILMAELETEERIVKLFANPKCLLKPDVLVSSYVITISTHGVGWYVIHDIETLRVVMNWALTKFQQYDSLFKCCGLDIDTYEEFKKCVSNKKAVNAKRNKVRRTYERDNDA